MGSKYYVPKIEEFYIGFEFENYYEEGKLMRHPSNTNGWKSEKFDWGWSDIIYDDYEHNQDEIYVKYRVKYLDKEDIESLGFILTQDENLKCIYNCRHKDGGINRRLSFDIEKYPNIETVHNGWLTIKNKSELKRLFDMIGIEYNKD